MNLLVHFTDALTEMKVEISCPVVWWKRGEMAEQYSALGEEYLKTSHLEYVDYSVHYWDLIYPKLVYSTWLSFILIVQLSGSVIPCPFLSQVNSVLLFEVNFSEIHS